MGKNIVFLNLADKHEDGLAKTSAEALRQKYPRYSWLYECFAGANQVQVIDLFELLQRDRTGFPFSSLQSLLPIIRSLQARLEIARLCASADKIMLGVHGRFGETERGFASMGWEQGSGVIGNYQEFAALLSSLLFPDRQYRLALIMCYGARSQNFRKKHDGQLDETDLKSSFAYKFYKELCRTYRITMTARTGSVHFNSQTGKSMVQTETATEAEFDKAEFQSSPGTKLVSTNYETLQEQMWNSGRLDEFYQMQEGILRLSGRPDSQDERVIYDFHNVQRQATHLESTSGQSASKYGKFVYEYNPDTQQIRITRKYDSHGNKVFQVLYEGAL